MRVVEDTPKPGCVSHAYTCGKHDLATQIFWVEMLIKFCVSSFCCIELRINLL